MRPYTLLWVSGMTGRLDWLWKIFEGKTTLWEIFHQCLKDFGIF